MEVTLHVNNAVMNEAVASLINRSDSYNAAKIILTDGRILWGYSSGYSTEHWYKTLQVTDDSDYIQVIPNGNDDEYYCIARKSEIQRVTWMTSAGNECSLFPKSGTVELSGKRYGLATHFNWLFPEKSQVVRYQSSQRAWKWYDTQYSYRERVLKNMGISMSKFQSMSDVQKAATFTKDELAVLAA